MLESAQSLLQCNESTMNYEDIVSLWLLKSGCRVRIAAEEEDKAKKFNAEAEDF